VAVTDVATRHKDSVRSLLQSMQEVMRGNASGAHDPNDADVWGILKAAYPGQVGACITAPVAEESQNPWFKSIIFHWNTSSYLKPFI